MITCKKRRRKNRGFTLVEILTVIAVIGILSSAVIIGGPKVLSIARVTTAQNDIKSLTAIVNDAAGKLGGTLPLTEFIPTPTVGTNQSGFTVLGSGAGLQGSTGDGFGGQARLEQVLMGFSQPLLDTYYRPNIGSQHFTRPDGLTAGEFVWDCTAMTVGNGDASCRQSRFYDAVTRLECAPVDITATPGALGTTGMNFRINGVNNLPAGRVAYIAYMSVPGVEAYNLALKVNGNALMTDTSGAGTTAQTSGKVTYAAATGGTTDVYVYLGNF